MASTAPSFDDLTVAFRHGNFKPLYFFYGDEGFLMDELQALLVEHALPPAERAFNLDLFHGPDANAQNVLAACMGYPVMAARRVVIVRQFEKLAENRAFKGYAEQPNPTAVVLLLCTGKPNLSAHPYRALREHAVAAEFKPLYDRQLPGWLNARAKTLGVTLDAGAAHLLAQSVGTDLRSAAAELDKLVVYAGARTTITDDDVLTAGGHSREFNVFELQKAIGEADRVRATAILERMLSQAASRRGEAIMIVTMLSRFFFKLRKLAGRRRPPGDLARHLGVSPYFVKEYEAAFRRLGARTVQRAFPALLAADFELKGGAERDERLVLGLALGRILAS